MCSVRSQTKQFPYLLLLKDLRKVEHVQISICSIQVPWPSMKFNLRMSRFLGKSREQFISLAFDKLAEPTTLYQRSSSKKNARHRSLHWSDGLLCIHNIQLISFPNCKNYLISHVNTNGNSRSEPYLLIHHIIATKICPNYSNLIQPTQKFAMKSFSQIPFVFGLKFFFFFCYCTHTPHIYA